MSQSGSSPNKRQSEELNHQAANSLPQLLVVKSGQGTNPANSPQESRADIQSKGTSALPPTNFTGTLEDDEISTFFRNRSMIAQGSFGMNPWLKVLLFLLGISAVYIGCWNHISQVRETSQKYLQGTLNFNISKFIPVWTKKATIFKKEYGLNSTEILESRTPQVATSASYEEEVMQVVSGQWERVDAYTQARCYRWQPSHECAVRAFALAYKGMYASIRPIATMDVSKLKRRDQWLMLYSTSLVSGNSKAFSSLMQSAKQDPQYEKLLFDAKLKAAARDKSAQEFALIMPLIPTKNVNDFEIAKWRALEVAGKVDQMILSPKDAMQAKKSLSQFLQKFGMPTFTR